MNISTRQSHRCRRQTYGYREIRLGGGISWETGMDINTQLQIRKSESVSRSVVSASATPWTAARQAPLSMEFSRRECWSGLPFPFPGDLPNPGIKPTSPVLADDFFTIWGTREQITDKDLLPSMGTLQSSVMAYTGKQSKNEWTYV